jgi:predicted MFS family arabinose efflux permease
VARPRFIRSLHRNEKVRLLLVLSIPTMWWIIASGALHNFNMYAIGAFLSPFLQRVHHVSKLNAGMIAMVVYGLAGVPGLVLGGMLGDRMVRHKPNGRLVVSTVAIFISAPLMYLGLSRTGGRISPASYYLPDLAWPRCTCTTLRFTPRFRT